MRTRLDQVLPLLALVVTGVVVIAMSAADGSWISAAVLLTLLAALAWWAWPARRGRHMSHQEAQAAAGDGDVIVYWRPGCTYCTRLQLRLRGVGRDVSWVNIWQDPEAAAFVASQWDGNETVPTAVTGAGAMIPATADSIRTQLAAR
jgi:glutaredoxin